MFGSRSRAGPPQRPSSIPAELHRAYNANGADAGAVYRNVNRSGGIFHLGLVAWCMQGSMLQSIMLTTRSFTRNVKTDDDHLADWVPQHLLDWRFILHNDWNAQCHRLVALCVACFLLMCNPNERVHGSYGRASEGAFLLVHVDHDQCHTLP